MDYPADSDYLGYITTINRHLEKREHTIQSLYRKTLKRFIRVERNRLRLASYRCRQQASELLRQCSVLQQSSHAAEVAFIRQEAEFLLNQAFDLEFEACRLDIALE